MDWLKRHLNWAYIAVLAFYYMVCLILGFALGVFAPETPDVALDVMAYILAFAIMLPLSIVVIKAKGRSLWWLLLAGCASPLWLPSKHKRSEGVQ